MADISMGMWRMFPIKGIVPVGVLVSLLVGVGGLEPLELRLFDEMVQQSPPAPPSQRIVIVGITEADIQELDHYPISDRVLAQVLSQILALNPAVVGLGLFRDVPVRYEGDGEKLTLEPREGSIVGADLAILVGAGLATQFRHSPITSQQNPPSPPITYPQ
ncbi:MAG: CHASE2 domain-containing protein, partial [Coleofasciculus sp. C2-GNP5-27]